MRIMRRAIAFLCAGALSLAWTASTHAAVLRFHYVPVDQAGNTTLCPSTRGCGGAGEVMGPLGIMREPTNQQPRPTHMVTFKHPTTGRCITVPMALPPCPPTMRYWSDRVIYDYGTGTVEARFLSDGSVDVVYNTGLLRTI